MTIINRRRQFTNKEVYTPLSWVGSSEDTTTYITFILDMQWKSSMVFEYRVQCTTATWAMCFNASVGRPSWNSDKNQIAINNSSRYTIHDWLYFGSIHTTGESRIMHDTIHTLKFDKGFYLDNLRLTTVDSPKSVAAGGKIWISGFKIAGLKIWDNDALILNLIPVLYGNEFGLLDTVNKTFMKPTSGSIIGSN